MEESQMKALVLEHAKLTAAHAGGDSTVLERLRTIEAALALPVADIAARAVQYYLADY